MRLLISVLHLLQVSKQPGETIYKGHRSYDLMLNLQLGIRFTVGRITSKPQPTTLSDSEFRRTVRPSPVPQPSWYRTMRRLDSFQVRSDCHVVMMRIGRILLKGMCEAKSLPMRAKQLNETSQSFRLQFSQSMQ